MSSTPLIPGSLSALGQFAESDSLARAIDEALPQRPAFGERERRELLIAIATGLLRYLKRHENAFTVSVTISGAPVTGTLSISIQA